MVLGVAHGSVVGVRSGGSWSLGESGPRWTNHGQTNTCENITFPRTTYVVGKINLCRLTATSSNFVQS